jgi:N-acetylneuraminic acid mutarotase
MPTARWGIMATVWNGKIYAFGGLNGSIPGNTIDVVEVYDIATDTWETLNPMIIDRGWGGAATIGDTIYVFGGFRTEGYQTVPYVHKYDPMTDSWSSDPDMPILRDCFMSASTDDKIYVIGGWSEYEDYEDMVQEYDPLTKVWTEKADMPTQRSFTEATIMNDTIYVAGGRGGSGDEFESYDISSDTWTVWSDMTLRREGTAVQAAGGSVYVIAGTRPNTGFPYYNLNLEASHFTGIEQGKIDEVPSKCQLFQNFPNPFNPATTIKLNLSQKDNIKLRIYDPKGVLIRTLVDAEFEAGHHTVTWDGTNENDEKVCSGTYIYTVDAGRYSYSKQMTLLK